MRTNDEQSPKATTALEIIESILATDKPENIRKHLREMVDSYLLAENEANYRESIYATYMNLDKFLCKAESLYYTVCHE